MEKTKEQILEQYSYYVHRFGANISLYKAKLAMDDWASQQTSSLRSENEQLRSEVERLKKEREWISVEDRLPEDERMVLCKTELQPIVQYVIASHDSEDDTWIDYDDCAYSITHWMPLPESPNNQNKEI